MRGTARLASALAAALLSAAAAPRALAHGGQYNPPGGSPGGIPPDREVLHPRVPVPTPPDRRDMTSWERWWDVNRDRYLDIRGRLRARDRRDAPTATAGEADPFDGPGPAAVVPAPASDPAVTREFLEREVLPALTKALRDGDAEVRSAAALALGKLGFPRSFIDLQGALADPVRDVRESAVLALGMAGEPMAAAQLRAVLLDPAAEERTRGYAAIALGLLGGGEAGEALLDYLRPASDAARVGGIRRRPGTECCVLLGLGLARHAPAAATLRDIALAGRDADGGRADASVRSFALVALAKIGDPGALTVAGAAALLEEDREVLRQGAALALGILAAPGDGAASAALGKAALGDRDRNVRALATMALARVGGEAAKETLRGLLEKGTRADLPFTALAVGILGDRLSAPLLRARFREIGDPSIRGALALALGLLRDGGAAPDLRAEAFGKGDRELRRHCMIALGMMEDAASAAPLRKVLEEEWDPHVKVAAGTALGLLKDVETLPRLEAIAGGSTSVLARGHACRILGAVGNRRAAKVLLGFVRDPKEQGFVRMYAVTGLGILGERGDLPLLSTLGFDVDPEVRNDALDEIATYM